MEEKKETIRKAGRKVKEKTAPLVKAAEENVTKAVKEVNANPSVREAKKAVKEAAKDLKPVVDEAKTGVKRAAKKATATARRVAAKDLKTSVHVQFAGKSYTTEELVKIAKDVWKYDLKRKVGDFKSVELYVKPEENQCYYVINGEVTGNFFI